MTVTLVVPEPISEELSSAAFERVESGGVLLARHTETPTGNVRLLGHELHWVPKHAYRTRGTTEMVITSEGFVPALAAADEHGSIPIWLHTHPGTNSSPRPSARDHVVDARLADLFRLRSGSSWYGALILSQAGDNLDFTGHIESADSRVEIDRMWATGARYALVLNGLHDCTPPGDMFDRSIRAFGSAIQSVLGELRVAVVGCGGTGSAVIEQLVRLGVRHLQVFDPDELTASNLTRVYGSYADDVGKPKVSVIASQVARIAPETEVVVEQSPITQEHTAKRLLDADVIFGCTDDNAGRLVLSRIATYFMTPVIDCGVLLSSSEGGRIEGIDGRVTVLGPGAACLVCRGRIDLQRAAAEMLTPSEHVRRVAEGYAPAMPGVEPAVVTYTTQVAAAAVSELLERLVHYGPEPPPTELLLRMHERELSLNRQSPLDGHYCDPTAGLLGRGTTEPFLGQTWQG